MGGRGFGGSFFAGSTNAGGSPALISVPMPAEPTVIPALISVPSALGEILLRGSGCVVTWE